jgi:hypothetical protein
MGSITAHAQSYSITSRAIAGGGGTSSGGAYAVTGAIAQPDASAASTGGTYSLSGGFLAQYMALQQTGAPHLTIRAVAGSNVRAAGCVARSARMVPLANTSTVLATAYRPYQRYTSGVEEK